MEEVDKLYRDPKERAEEIHTILQLAAKELDMDHSLFDITCFSVQWLGMLATGEFSQDERLVDAAIRANKWLYDIHYNAPEVVHGKPDKEKKDEDQKS